MRVPHKLIDTMRGYDSAVVVGVVKAPPVEGDERERFELLVNTMHGAELTIAILEGAANEVRTLHRRHLEAVHVRRFLDCKHAEAVEQGWLGCRDCGAEYGDHGAWEPGPLELPPELVVEDDLGAVVDELLEEVNELLGEVCAPDVLDRLRALREASR